jgi:dTDP-4-amino-4,6-dideoxygalactose transaminase
VTQKSYYYYGFRYKKEAFSGLSREKFVAALNAEGIPSSTGIGVLDKLPMHREGMIEDAFRSKTYKKIYAREKLAAYAKENECPLADRLSEETVGFHQRMLLGAKADIDDIAGAILKIQRNQDELAAA